MAWNRTLAAAGATAAGLLAALSFGAPAHAGGSIDINPGNVPTTAVGHPDKECDAQQGGGPFPDQDVWVFNLPGKHATTGDFTSVTAKFDNTGDQVADVTVVIEAGAADGDDIVTTLGTSRAWVRTPAGWTLVAASATITGTADKFVLTHTCVATGTSPSPSTGVTPTPTPTPTPTASQAGSPSPSPLPTGSQAPATSPAPAPSPSAPGGGGSLPVTGAAVGGIALAGAALVAGGVALLTVRRRRITTVADGDAQS